MSEEEKYECCICHQRFNKENIYGNYENYVCDECWNQKVIEKE